MLHSKGGQVVGESCGWKQAPTALLQTQSLPKGGSPFEALGVELRLTWDSVQTSLTPQALFATPIDSLPWTLVQPPFQKNGDGVYPPHPLPRSPQPPLV